MFKRVYILLFLITVLSGIVTSCGNKTTETGQCALPTFNPEGGTYAFFAAVTISCATSDAVIRYTIDGTEPGTNSLVYSNFITLLTTTTIKAQAYKSGWTASEVATATYTIE